MDGPEFKGSIFEEFGRVAAAFGSSKRVEISDLLAQGERTVESIASATGMMLANAERLAVGPPDWHAVGLPLTVGAGPASGRPHDATRKRSKAEV